MPDSRRNPAAEALRRTPEPQPMPPQARFVCVVQGFEMGAVSNDETKQVMFSFTAKFPVGEAELLWPLQGTPGVLEGMQQTYDVASANESKPDLAVARSRLIVPGGAP